MASPSKAERPATYEDANLLLRLYELRREDKTAPGPRLVQ